MSDRSFSVVSPVFEGPLDVLLLYIKKRKLHISEISLSLITDDVIDHISRSSYSHDELLELLRIVSTLLLIKSQALLPQSSRTLEEQEEIDELTHSLELYDLLTQHTQWIDERLQQPTPRSCSVSIQKTPRSGFDTTLTKTMLFKDMRNLIDRIVPLHETPPHHILSEKVLLSTLLSTLRERCTTSMKESFSHLSTSLPYSPVLLFIALLELVKQGHIDMTQQDQDISITSSTITLPRYGTHAS